MSGVSKIEIHESGETLLALMKQQKKLAMHERVQALYLLKSGEADSIAHVGRILGHNRVTVQRWLSEYRESGLKGLLAPKAHGGRQASIPPWAQTKLKKRLQQPRGFASYGEIVDWLASECGIQVRYSVVYDLVKKRWGAKLKRPRPCHSKKDSEAVDEFPHRLMSQLRKAVRVAPDLQLRYWVEDESRFGLKPILRRRITARGVAPISLEYWRFEWLWLYGFVEPLTGESFFWEFSRLDNVCFSSVLDRFAEHYPDDMHIIQMDCSAVHTTPKLIVPENVAFCFQPPYSPELNPIEQLWAQLKGQLANRQWFDFDELRRELSHEIRSMTHAGLRSLMQRNSLINAFDYAGLRPKQLGYP